MPPGNREFLEWFEDSGIFSNRMYYVVFCYPALMFSNFIAHLKIVSPISTSFCFTVLTRTRVDIGVGGYCCSAQPTN